MGNVNGQEPNSLLSKRLRKITSERLPAVKKQEQSNSVVAKIERVLFAYRETLAYYQDILEQFEKEYHSNEEKSVPIQTPNLDSDELQNLNAQFKAFIQEFEQKLQAFKELGENQLNALQQVSIKTIPVEEECATLENEEPGFILVDETLGAGPYETESSSLGNAAVTRPHKDMQDILNGIEQLKTSISSLSKDVGAITTVGVDSKEEDYLVHLEAYNKNLTDIRKRLDELMRFVGKVDGSIVEALKSHTNENRDALLGELNLLKAVVDNRNKGIKPLLVFNLIFSILSVGGIAVIILNYLGILKF